MRLPSSMERVYAGRNTKNGGHAMTAKLTDRIDTLEQRLRELKAKHQRSEARRRTVEARRDRREETRRKILVGAVVLAKVEQGVLEAAVLHKWLDGALTRSDDRALFALDRREAP
jgi:hypothetical protein